MPVTIEWHLTHANTFRLVILMRLILLRRSKRKEKMLPRLKPKGRKILEGRAEEDSLLRRGESIWKVKRMRRMTNTCKSPSSLERRKKSLATSRSKIALEETRPFKMKRRKVMRRRKKTVTRRTYRLKRAIRRTMMRSQATLLHPIEFQRRLISSRATPMSPQKVRSTRESTLRVSMMSHPTNSCTTSLENTPSKRRIATALPPEISS